MQSRATWRHPRFQFIMFFKREDPVAYAEQLVAKGKVDAAIAEYVRILRKTPDDLNVLNRLGDLLSRTGRKSEAIEVFRRISKHYTRDGFFLKAIAILKKIVRLDPLNPQIYSELADLYARQGMISEAKGQYLFLAEHYRSHGEPESLLVTLRKVVEIDPDAVEIRLRIAELALQADQIPEAVAEFRAVAMLLLKRHNVDEAVRLLRKVHELQPDSVEVVETLVTILVERGERQEAIDLLKGVLRTNPENQSAMSLIEQIESGSDEMSLLRDDDPPDSFPCAPEVEEGEESEIELVEELLMEAETFQSYGLIERCLEAYRKVLEMDPDNIAALGGIAEISIDSGNRESVARDGKRYLERLYDLLDRNRVERFEDRLTSAGYDLEEFRSAEDAEALHSLAEEERRAAEASIPIEFEIEED